MRTTSTPKAGAPLVWDERLWEDAWERLLSHPERHRIAVQVWRGEAPADPFEQRVATELARRWRRSARNLALLYGLWALFWGLLTWDDWRPDGILRSLLTISCALVGVAAVGACFATRRRLRKHLRRWPATPADPST